MPLTLDRSVIEERFSRLKPKNPERADAVRQMFGEAGCQYAEEQVKGSKLPNFV